MEESAALPCVDKIAFDSQKAAQAAATVARYQHGIRVKPYRCKYCNLWHLATTW